MVPTLIRCMTKPTCPQILNLKTLAGKLLTSVCSRRGGEEVRAVVLGQEAGVPAEKGWPHRLREVQVGGGQDQEEQERARSVQQAQEAAGLDTLRLCNHIVYQSLDAHCILQHTHLPNLLTQRWDKEDCDVIALVVVVEGRSTALEVARTHWSNVCSASMRRRGCWRRWGTTESPRMVSSDLAGLLDLQIR